MDKSTDWLNRWVFAGGDNWARDVYVAGKPDIQDFIHPVEQQAKQQFIALLKRIF